MPTSVMHWARAGVRLALIVGCFWGARAAEAAEDPETPAADGAVSAEAVVTVAGRLLDQAQVSYVYGGSQLGDGAACQACNTCLEAKHPAPKARLKACPRCNACSLDCSHFTELVFREAGLPYPYLDTALMLSLPPAKLLRNYHLIDLGTDLDRAAPGDLLVYDGHVVLLERLHERVPGQAAHRGDVVHATGGKDIRRPGEGIQRERFVDLVHFRGPLLRILRRSGLAGLAVQSGKAPLPKPVLTKDSPQPAPPGLRKLRPIVKRGLGDG